MAKIVWSPSSIKDIDAIAEYIAKDSFKAAKNIVELFFIKAEISSRSHIMESKFPKQKIHF